MPVQYYASGTIVTGTLDLGNIPTSAPVVTVGWQKQSSANNVTVVQSRSSTDGVTWSTWTAPAADGKTLTSPNRRYWQIELSLTTSDPSTTPIVDLLILRADRLVTINANWVWSYGGQWG